MTIHKIEDICEQYGPDETCGDYYSCCSCGGDESGSCGCPGCFDCNACEVCNGEREPTSGS